MDHDLQFQLIVRDSVMNNSYIPAYIIVAIHKHSGSTIMICELIRASETALALCNIPMQQTFWVNPHFQLHILNRCSLVNDTSPVLWEYHVSQSVAVG